MKIKNKIFLCSILLLLILSLFSFTYATEELKDIGNSVKNATEDAKDGMQNMTNSAKDGMENMTNDVKNGMDNNDENTISENLTGNYNTTRTTSDDVTATATNNATMWMWLMLAVVAVLIIALVWYYAAQSNNSRH